MRFYYLYELTHMLPHHLLQHVIPTHTKCATRYNLISALRALRGSFGRKKNPTWVKTIGKYSAWLWHPTALYCICVHYRSVQLTWVISRNPPNDNNRSSLFSRLFIVQPESFTPKLYPHPLSLNRKFYQDFSHWWKFEYIKNIWGRSEKTQPLEGRKARLENILTHY